MSHNTEESCKIWRETYFPTGTWRPRDVPWKSSKGRNVRDLQGTFMGLSGDQYKKLMI